MAATEWTLSAPATAILVELPPAGGNPQPLPADAAPVRLALQELLARGALTMTVVREGVWMTEVTLAPGNEPDELPQSLDRLYRSLRPLVPGHLKEVAGKAHRRNPVLTSDLRKDARRELLDRELIEQRSVRRLARRPLEGWNRTPAGDALAADGARYLERLREEQNEVDRDSAGGMAALFEADEAPAAQHEPIELEGGRRRNEDLWMGDGGGD